MLCAVQLMMLRFGHQSACELEAVVVDQAHDVEPVRNDLAFRNHF